MTHARVVVERNIKIATVETKEKQNTKEKTK